MDAYKESHYRSVIKALSWRVFATIATISIVYVFTRRLVLSLEVGLVEVILKLILYYCHERVWGWLGFGKRKHPLAAFQVSDKLSPEDLETIRDQLVKLGYIEEG